MDKHDSLCAAPPDPQLRYDDSDYTLADSDYFKPLWEDRFGAGSGYIFHEACWRLFSALLYPAEVSIERLTMLCRSLPGQGLRYLSWGHHYGGIAQDKQQNRYQWEDPDVMSSREASNEHLWHSDPDQVSELQALLEETSRTPQNGLGQSPVTRIASLYRKADCFAPLPPEILGAILCRVSTSDLMNSCLSSRTIATLPLNQSFWSSRFLPKFERDFVYEVRDSSFESSRESAYRDWRKLYQETGSSRCAPGLQNRRRIWDVNRSLADLLLLMPCSISDNELGPSESPGPSSWRSATGQLYDGVRNFSTGCRELVQQTVTVPLRLSRIVVSVIDFNGLCHISGLRLLEHNGSETCLGYVVKGREVILDTSPDSGEVAHLSGFHVAIGARGLGALRIVTTTGHVSPWAGRVDGLPRTLRLSGNQELSKVKAGFDV